ncbi:transporter, partial [Pseudomonas sp. PAGU 2196]|uniref:SphA family protein n=1 Tax=Pseudomonas sp. PAGU 2196 TaxID=2793997 RepID=UPI001EE0507A
DYRSGQEFHVDYAVGWGLGNGWVLGVGGYYYRQTTDDRQDGERIEDNKGRSFAIGPSIKYSGEEGWFVTAKWSKETEVRNRAQGDAYWVKLTLPF